MDCNADLATAPGMQYLYMPVLVQCACLAKTPPFITKFPLAEQSGEVIKEKETPLFAQKQALSNWRNYTESHSSY